MKPIPRLLAGIVLFSTSSFAQQAPAADARWQALLSQLASDNFAQRQAAQKQLDQLTWRDLDQLKHFAETTPDPEAKSRLAARLLSLEEQMAYDPPPISLELKDASLADVVAALEKATGEKFNDSPVGARAALLRQGGPTFTLSAKDQPFWEIFRDLSLQHGLVLLPQPTGSGFRLGQQSPGMRPTQIVGGVAIFAKSITRTAVVYLQNLPGQQVQPASLTFDFSVVVDPRIKLVTAQPPRLFNVIDDAGNTLLNVPPVPAPDDLTRLPSALIFRPLNASISLPILEHAGKKIASAKGNLALTLQLASDTIVVDDISTMLNQPIRIGGQTVLITEFTLQGQQLRYGISLTAPRILNRPPPPPITMAILDATGQQLHALTLAGNVGGTFSNPNMQPPFKLQFTTATKTKEVTIPFELKDLPLP